MRVSLGGSIDRDPLRAAFRVIVVGEVLAQGSFLFAGWRGDKAMDKAGLGDSSKFAYRGDWGGIAFWAAVGFWVRWNSGGLATFVRDEAREEARLLMEALPVLALTEDQARRLRLREVRG
jgi:hypothetical protein